MGICVSGKYAYVTGGVNGNYGVTIFDISDPTNPTQIGSILESDDPGNITLDGSTSIYVSGKYAYVTAWNDGGVAIIDISDPSNPTQVGSITDTSVTTLESANSIYISGKYAYVTSSGEDGVEILDISDPTNPTHVGEINQFSSTGNVLDNARKIYVSGKYAYVTAFNDDGVAIIDISDPSNPTQVGSIKKSTDPDNILLDGASSIYVSGKYAYVTALNDHAVVILDISDPVSPVQVGTITNAATLFLNNPRSICVVGKYAYVVIDETMPSPFDGLVILDISDPTNPTYVTNICDGELANANSIYVSGKYAYLTVSHGLAVIDITGMDVPTAHIGAIATSKLDVSENAQIGNNLYINGGLNVGPGGMKSDGPVSIKDVLTLVPRASVPANPVVGTVYYNSNDGQLHIYNGTAWCYCVMYPVQ